MDNKNELRQMKTALDATKRRIEELRVRMNAQRDSASAALNELRGADLNIDVALRNVCSQLEKLEQDERADGDLRWDERRQRYIPAGSSIAGTRGFSADRGLAADRGFLADRGLAADRGFAVACQQDEIGGGRNPSTGFL